MEIDRYKDEDDKPKALNHPNAPVQVRSIERDTTRRDIITTGKVI